MTFPVHLILREHPHTVGKTARLSRGLSQLRCVSQRIFQCPMAIFGRTEESQTVADVLAKGAKSALKAQDKERLVGARCAWWEAWGYGFPLLECFQSISGFSGRAVLKHAGRLVENLWRIGRIDVHFPAAKVPSNMPKHRGLSRGCGGLCSAKGRPQQNSKTAKTGAVLSNITIQTRKSRIRWAEDDDQGFRMTACRTPILRCKDLPRWENREMMYHPGQASNTNTQTLWNRIELTDWPVRQRDSIPRRCWTAYGGVALEIRPLFLRGTAAIHPSIHLRLSSSLTSSSSSKIIAILLSLMEINRVL